MATDRVLAQMMIDKKCRSSMRYAAKGKEAAEICRTLYVQDSAFEELGKPEEILVVIEAHNNPLPGLPI